MPHHPETRARLLALGRRFLFPAGLVFLVAGPALAQRGAVRGKIVDPDGKPLSGVSVSIVMADGGSRPVTLETNDKGEFIRAGLRVEMYRVSFELEGYEPLQAFVSVSNGAQAFINETMHPLPEGVLSRSQADQFDRHLQKAQDAFGDGDFQTAASEYRAMLDMMPTSAPVYHNLASALERAEDFEGAIAAYEKAFELDASMQDGLLVVAGLHGRRNDWGAALDAYDRAGELLEGNAVHLFNYAVFATNAGRTDLATEFLEKATIADPGFSLAFYQLGMAKLAEDPEGAIAALERYLETDPEGQYAVSVREVLDRLRQ